jgi:hypothetical protein
MQTESAIDFSAIELSPELETPDMANAAELTVQIGKLEERVNNHIKFFWGVAAAGFAWLAILSLLLYNINNNVKTLAVAQADTPAKIVAKLLSEPQTSSAKVASNLNAAATILRASKIGKVKPESSVLSTVSSKLAEAQTKYPDLPEVWQTTGVFITYKSEARLPVSQNTPFLTRGIGCNSQAGGAGWIFSNCEVTLEDIAERITGSTVNGSPAPFTFIHCIVHYSGGRIPAKQLTFVDCNFSFEVLIVPPREGMAVMRQLTAAPDENNTILLLG